MADETNISGPTFTPKNLPSDFLPQGPCHGLPLSPSLPLSASPQLHLLDLALRLKALQPLPNWEFVFSVNDLGLERLGTDYRPLVALPGSGTATVLSEGPSLSKFGDYDFVPSMSFFGVHNFFAAAISAFSRSAPVLDDPVSVVRLSYNLGSCASESLGFTSDVFRCVSVGDPSAWDISEPYETVETVPAPESWAECADKFIKGHPFSSMKANPFPDGFSGPPYDKFPKGKNRPSAWAASHLPLSCYPEACAAFAQALKDHVANVTCGSYRISSGYDGPDHVQLLVSASVYRPALTHSIVSKYAPDVGDPTYVENKADKEAFCVRFIAAGDLASLPNGDKIRLHALLEVKAYAHQLSYRDGDGGGSEVCAFSDDVVAYLAVTLKPRKRRPGSEGPEDGKLFEWVLEDGVDGVVSAAHDLVLKQLRAKEVPLLGPKPPKATLSSEAIDEGDPPTKKWDTFGSPVLTGRFSVGADLICPVFRLPGGFFDAAT